MAKNDKSYEYNYDEDNFYDTYKTEDAKPAAPQKEQDNKRQPNKRDNNNSSKEPRQKQQRDRDHNKQSKQS